MKTEYITIILCLIASGCMEECKDNKTDLGTIKNFEIYHVGLSEITCKIFTENNTIYIRDSATCRDIDYNKSVYKLISENCIKGFGRTEWYEIGDE